jgi:hypothetical protein
MARLCEQVTSREGLIIDHYALTIGWYTKTAPLFGLWLKRLPGPASLRLIERMVDPPTPAQVRSRDGAIAGLSFITGLELPACLSGIKRH